MFASIMAVALAFPPGGFEKALIDFAFFVLFAYLADAHYKPALFYRWVFFVLCVIISLLFFLAWIVDLGARINF